jgi:thiol-disulfide isomerase/thioredoxin
MGFDCGMRAVGVAWLSRFLSRRSFSFRLLTLLIGSALVMSAGCAGDGPTTGSNASTGTTVVESSSAEPHSAPREVVDPSEPGSTPPPSESAIGVQVAGVEEYDQTLQSLRGQVVLVDFWATWCIPCVQQFPHTVSLHQQHRDRGLAVISVSMNDPSEEAGVLTFLRNRQADFHNILGKYGAGTEFAESFDLRGDIPFYKLYDRGGRLRYQFSAEPEGIENGLPISEMDGRVEELLAEESP